ncbi:Oidioi.mRNA.OKI2018_I69.chr2.g4810.t1.cds [Oikopleura dioica]|uniref:Oidioi.mRNA.OKI2018_I69.chr2.g4810.t1.cds n=1 Tax=Oikopleura dioica TaxID=34765 RepID=A0ABN7T2S8_OIKDI|nr:Oidioi.mRNA.OKI2018_I69.chr2.g4810.t1.cds [Oikopleura dioica]
MKAILLLFFLDFCKTQYSGDYFDNYEIQDDDKEILEIEIGNLKPKEDDLFFDSRPDENDDPEELDSKSDVIIFATREFSKEIAAEIVEKMKEAFLSLINFLDFFHW